MKYHQPFGETDPDAGYQNGNPATGAEGSIPPAEQMEFPQREIVNGLLASNLTPSDTELTQLAQAMSIGIYVGAFTGSANALSATLPGSVVFAALQTGLVIHGTVGVSPNTSAATLNVSGFTAAPGAKPILRKDGTSALTAGDLPAGALVSFRYDGTDWRHVGSSMSDIVAIIKANTVVYNPSPVLYVRTDGNDSNDGSANTAAKAFATIAAAIAYGTRAYYFPGGTLTIQLGTAGTYAAPNGSVSSSAGAILIQGDAANQANYLISGAGPVGGSSAVIAASGATVTFVGVTLVNTSSLNHTLGAVSNATINLLNVTFQNNTSSVYAQIFAGSNSVINLGAGCISATGNNTGYLFNASYGGTIQMNNNYSVGPTTAAGFATICGVSSGGRFVVGAGNPTFTGLGAAGQRYLVNLNGVIATNGGGANFFPGTTAGSATTGGQYA